MKYAEGDLVLIEWLDSEQSNQIWHSLSAAKEEAVISKTRTVGFIVEQNKEYIAISQSWDEAEGHEPSIAGLFTIPCGCIKSIQRVYTRNQTSKK